MRTKRIFIVTTDGKEFEWDGESHYQRNKARDHQVAISDHLVTGKEALKKLSYMRTIVCSDGSEMTGEYNDVLGLGYQREKVLEREKNIKNMTNLLYCGNMTKEEFQDHIAQNYRTFYDLFNPKDEDDL